MRMWNISVAGTAAALLLLVPVAAPAGNAPAPVTAAAKRSCKSVTARGRRFRVVINRGAVSCRLARNVLRDFMSGKGIKHGGPSSAETYWTLRGWKCGTGAGGGGCIRHGPTYRTARDWISAFS
jgi:hypothetical protein